MNFDFHSQDTCEVDKRFDPDLRTVAVLGVYYYFHPFLEVLAKEKFIIFYMKVKVLFSSFSHILPLSVRVIFIESLDTTGCLVIL